MTTDEAKELYLKSNCSYFIMCTYHYSSYMEYRQLGLPKEQEDLWKNEKLRMLKVQMQKTGDYKIFGRLYDIAITFRDYPRLFMMWDAFNQIAQPLAINQRILVAETVLGKRFLKVRSGLIYWAYDIGQKGVAILLMDQVLKYLNIGETEDPELSRRVQKGKWICRKLNMELGLNFSERELQDYSMRKT